MNVDKMTPKGIEDKFKKLGGILPSGVTNKDGLDLMIMIAFLNGYKVGRRKGNKKDKIALNRQNFDIQSLKEQNRFLIDALKSRNITIDALNKQIRN